MSDQGDNHIKLIKQVLQQQFPRMDNAPVAQYVPYHRHCPGCGAPRSIGTNACAYCNTPNWRS